MSASNWREFKTLSFIPFDSEEGIGTEDGWLKNDVSANFEEDFTCMWLPETDEKVVVYTKKENAKHYNIKY